MIDNHDLPQGFINALAQNAEALSKYAKLSDEEKIKAGEGARQVHSKQEMKNYVNNSFHL